MPFANCRRASGISILQSTHSLNESNVGLFNSRRAKVCASASASTLEALSKMQVDIKSLPLTSWHCLQVFIIKIKSQLKFLCISFTNDELTSRLVNDRGEYFMEVLVDKDKWLLLTDFVEQKHHGSTFNLDLKLHKLYVTDSSLATNIKLLPKFLLLANSNDK